MSSRHTAIMIAAHKPYDFPQDDGYFPLHVGKQNCFQDIGIPGDDGGDNISCLNPFFCELTGLYWMWKNMQADHYGLVHYRRYFRPVANGESLTLKGQSIATSESLVEQLKHHDVVLSKRRNYWIESVEKHYANAHNRNDLKILHDAIVKFSPEFLPAMEAVMKGRTLSLYNMFVMPADVFSRYCDWLFLLLFHVKEKIPYQDYGPYQRRVFGFLAERMLNIWVLHSVSADRVCYQPVVNLEGENILLKAKGLLARKFTGQKQN